MKKKDQILLEQAYSAIVKEGMVGFSGKYLNTPTEKQPAGITGFTGRRIATPTNNPKDPEDKKLIDLAVKNITSMAKVKPAVWNNVKAIEKYIQDIGGHGDATIMNRSADIAAKVHQILDSQGYFSK